MNTYTKKPLESLLRSLESGKRPKGGVKDIKSGVPSIGGEHISSDGSFKFSRIKYVPNEFAEKMIKGRIEIGDILVVKDGATTAKTSFVSRDFQFKNAVINEHVFLCRVKETVVSKYIFYYLWSEKGRSEILKDFRGAAQGGITTGFTKTVSIPIPDDPTIQQKIVDKIDELFSELDDSKKTLEKSIKSITTLKSSVLKRAFYENDSEIIKLKDLLSEPLKNGHSAKASNNPNGVPTLTLSAITYGDFSKQNIKITSADRKRVSDLWLESGDILIERSNTPELVGISRTYDGPDDYAIFPDLLIRLRISTELTSVKYIQYYLDYLYISGYFQKIARGTSGTMPKINQTMIEEIEVPCGSLSEQSEIIDKIDEALSEIENISLTLESSLKSSHVLRQSILKRAFSGSLVLGEQK